MDWRPKEPNNRYEPLRESAWRARRKRVLVDCGGVEIGVVHAKGETNEVISAIADEAGKRGGTHYIVEGDDTERELNVGPGLSVHTDETRMTWAVVYRVPKDGWDCSR
jgi:hypothetical protein